MLQKHYLVPGLCHQTTKQRLQWVYCGVVMCKSNVGVKVKSEQIFES